MPTRGKCKERLLSVVAREIHLRSRPPGLPTVENFELATRRLEPPSPGQLLVRNLWMSVDPYMRGRMIDQQSYLPPFQIGQPLEGSAVGIVEESRDERYRRGDVVGHFSGWRDYSVIDAVTALAVDTNEVSPRTYLGILGIPAITAYVAMARICEPKPGETVFISSAAGAVGMAACQMAKLNGCRVVGSTSSDQKARWLRDELGVDAVINYKTAPDLQSAVAQACPKGIDIYFDHVGGKHLEVALTLSNRFARFALIGMIEQYNDTTPAPGPSNLILAVAKNVKLQGMLVLDHMDVLPDFMRDMLRWMKEGKIRSHETVAEGLEQAPQAFIGLFKGENTGKMLVKIAAE